ncbi:hypothetical protein [Streptococcus ovis]|uniref:hypothetical protein n=1 Tax=Streptococcus ovis TaxID=82806 RepID=UPI000365E0FC|nr:hypothetical protein [Streptococcus ovis]
MTLQIKIDFFSNQLVEAIGAGVYQVSIQKENGECAPLYIGESVFVLVRCATHLFEFKKNPAYFGFNEKSINNSNITLKFELCSQIDNRQERKQYEKELIKKTMELQPIICQSGISDRMKGIDLKIDALNTFLNQQVTQ